MSIPDTTILDDVYYTECDISIEIWEQTEYTKKKDNYAPISSKDFKQMVGDDVMDDQVDLFKQ